MVDVLPDKAEQPAKAPGRSFWAWPWPIGRFGLVAYLIVLTWYVITQGLPLDRIGQTGWVVLGILLAGLGRTWREHVRVFADWLPLLVALILFDKTRGIADTLGMPVRVLEIVDMERGLFGDTLPTAWLQQHLHEPAQVFWYDTVVAVVYFSHFVFAWVVATAFYLVSRPLWSQYIRRLLLLTYTGLLIYILVPAAPPWYAARFGYVTESIDRITGNGWRNMGLSIADHWLSKAQGGANPVAAMPSLHAAFSLLVVMALWPLVARWRPRLRQTTRVALAAYPLLMAFTLVYGGEHYVVDILFGWLLVGVVILIARRFDPPQARVERRSITAAEVTSPV